MSALTALSLHLNMNLLRTGNFHHQVETQMYGGCMGKLKLAPVWNTSNVGAYKELDTEHLVIHQTFTEQQLCAKNWPWC